MKQLTIGICIAASIAALTAIGIFISHFGFGFASNIGNWGAVGDFFGGILNPTFALLSLILIAYTLMQNKKALVSQCGQLGDDPTLQRYASRERF